MQEEIKLFISPFSLSLVDLSRRDSLQSDSSGYAEEPSADLNSHLKVCLFVSHSFFFKSLLCIPPIFLFHDRHLQTYLK